MIDNDELARLRKAIAKSDARWRREVTLPMLLLLAVLFGLLVFVFVGALLGYA